MVVVVGSLHNPPPESHVDGFGVSRNHHTSHHISHIPTIPTYSDRNHNIALFTLSIHCRIPSVTVVLLHIHCHTNSITAMNG